MAKKKTETETTEKTYLVQWEIDIIATSKEDAAKQALQLMQDKDSTATIFIVRKLYEMDDPTQIDVAKF